MRIITAFNFLAVIGLFFLPWIDIRCEVGDKKVSLYEQSGFQAAAGEVSMGKNFQEMAALAKAGGGPVADLQGQKATGAPVLFAYVGALAVGLVVSLIAPAGKKWRAGVLICAGMAIGLLATQTAAGFPITENSEKAAKEFGLNGGGFGAKIPGAPVPKITSGFFVSYFLSWLFAFTCLLCAALDGVFVSRVRALRE